MATPEALGFSWWACVSVWQHQFLVQFLVPFHSLLLVAELRVFNLVGEEPCAWPGVKAHIFIFLA